MTIKALDSHIKALEVIEAQHCHMLFAGGMIIGDMPPYEAFPIGGTNSVRGYSEGGAGTGRNYIAGTAELHVPLVSPVEVSISFSSHPSLNFKPAPGNAWLMGLQQPCRCYIRAKQVWALGQVMLHPPEHPGLFHNHACADGPHFCHRTRTFRAMTSGLVLSSGSPAFAIEVMFRGSKLLPDSLWTWV